MLFEYTVINFGVQQISKISSLAKEPLACSKGQCPTAIHSTETGSLSGQSMWDL
jgi:hypothetical protein